MKDIKTLATIAAEVESGKIYYRETTVKVGNFESFADFMSYFNQHYRPMLEEWRDNKHLPNEQLFNHFCDDMLSAFADENEETDEPDTIAIVYVKFADADNYERAKRFFDSEGPSQFWAGDWTDETRTIEFTEGNDPDALETALRDEMDAESIEGYSFTSRLESVA